MQLVNRKVTYRLYPSPLQEAKLHEMLVLHQRLYNAALEQRIAAYRRQKKTLTFAEQCRELTALRRELPQYEQLNCHSSQSTLRRLDLAYKHFFRRVREGAKEAGFPRFKAVDRFSGWGYTSHGDGWKLHSGEGNKHGHLRLMGVGNVKLRGKARTAGKPKTLEITRKAKHWYASVTIECAPERECGTRAAGIDWGVETFATVAFVDGTHEAIPNPRHLAKSLSKLKAEQKEMSRKKRRSNNRAKARERVARLHQVVANQRLDFLHKVTALLVGTLGLIATETLNVKGMTAGGGAYKRGLNRSILDTAPAAFLQLLRYKAEEAGVEWVEIPTRQVKPSQTCHACGRQEKKSLADRTHDCPCRAALGRDVNAARVMLNWALRASGREPSWCGAESVDSAAKHETPPVAA